jgi:hypothetical protein
VKPETIRGIWIAFSIVLAGLVAGDLFVHHHEHFGIDGTFGFYAWYGFSTCVSMVLGAKLLGIVLKRSDTYYGADPDTGAGEGSVEETEDDGSGRGRA